MGIFGIGSRKRSHDADAVITGAGSGIGAAFALELAHRGGRVVCSDIDESAARTTADAITADGGQALALRCDVSDIDDVELLACEAQSWFDGPPTLVINNAGVGAGGATDRRHRPRRLDLGARHQPVGPDPRLPRLRPDSARRSTGHGGIINVASAAAFGAAPGMAAYNVSKAGVLSLSETLAAELSGTGVNVTVLCPTFVKTNIVEAGRITAKSTQLADRLMRWTGISPRTGRPDVPGHQRPWRPVLHAATGCPDRLGHQTFRPDGVHPRRRSHHPRHQLGEKHMAIDMDAMLAKIKDRQWALADIDWDAPGAEMISDEQRPKLKAFMADLCWIENIGARGFAALAKKAPTPTIAEIYRYFHAEEQRHANAELALMKRWGMLDDGESCPSRTSTSGSPSTGWTRYADDMSLSILGTVIPMLEVALDGALLKFLLDEVDDPVCHQVFEKINNDESRHIAVDFEVLNMIGHARSAASWPIEFVGNVATPGLIIGAMMYVPLLNRMRNKIVGMGLEPERLYNGDEAVQGTR